MIEAMYKRAQTLPWWMVSTVRLDTLSHQSLQWQNNEQGDWRPCWPVLLWSSAERDGLWLLSWVWYTREVGVLVESCVAGGVLAACHAHLSVKVLSWVKVLRREAAWRHSALTRACSRLSREAHVCREKQTTRGLETGGWVAKDCLQQMMAPLILLWSQTDAILELLDSGILAHIQIIGFPWIDRCSPFTTRTPDCLHKIFLPLSSWNVFTGNNNSKIIAMKRTGNENELMKLAMNGIPTPCELNRSLIAQSWYRRDKLELSLLLFWLKHFIFVVFLTSCSLRKRLSQNSTSSRAFHKLSVSPWLTVPACSSCSRSVELTWLRLAHLGMTCETPRDHLTLHQLSWYPPVARLHSNQILLFI